MAVKVTPLPDGGVGPSARQIGLCFSLHVAVVRRELCALSHVAHHVEEPVAHSAREVAHLGLGALRHLAAFAEVLDVDVQVFLLAAACQVVFAAAPGLVHGAV